MGLMAKCHFCGRKFHNKQAVRSHLKKCPIYRFSVEGEPRTLICKQCLDKRGERVEIHPDLGEDPVCPECGNHVFYRDFEE